MYSVWDFYVMPIKIKGGMNSEISFELTGNQSKGKLWVYGDSFAAQPAPWLDMIAKELNLIHTNHAWPGSSLDYSSVQINKTMNSMRRRSAKTRRGAKPRETRSQKGHPTKCHARSAWNIQARTNSGKTSKWSAEFLYYTRGCPPAGPPPAQWR